MTHHECGSNQSGSDSGLGYTNSLSSENNSLLTTNVEEPDRPAINGTDSAEPTNRIKDYSRAGDKKCNETDSLCKTSKVENANIVHVGDKSLSSLCPTSLPAAQTDHNNKNQTVFDDAPIVDSSTSNNRDGNSSGNIKNVPSTSTSLPLSQAKGDSGPEIQRGQFASEIGLNNEKAATALPPPPPHRHHEEETASVATTAKIKHTTQHKPRESSSRARRCGDTHDVDDELDKIARESHDHKTRGGHHACPNSDTKHASPVNSRSRASPAMDVAHVIRPSHLKSCFRPVGTPSVAKHNRNVSFNQTVIVFCEEVEASSPSDTFEPPLDYQDTSRDYGKTGDDESAGENIGAGSREIYATDNLEIINKIVNEDASNLTDDQLIGLLESESFLQELQVTSGHSNRISPDHGFLRDDAISDTDSESSLILKESNEPSSLASMPARIKVSTVDSRRNQQPIGLHAVSVQSQKSALIQPVNNPQLQKVVQYQNGEIPDLQGNIEPAPPAHRLTPSSSIAAQKRQNPANNQPVVADRESTCDATHSIQGCIRANTQTRVDATHRPTYQQSGGTSPISGSQAQSSGPGEAQVKHSACHICRAIESSRRQTNAQPSGNNIAVVRYTQHPKAPVNDDGHSNQKRPIELTQGKNHALSTVSNQAKQPQPVPTCVSCREISMRQQNKQQISQHQQHIYGAQTIRPVQSGTMGGQQQQQYHNQHSAQPNTRPIACQLVYVVDQHGNHIRALQVVRSKSILTTSSSGVQQHQFDQMACGSGGYRPQNPTNFTNPHQLLRMPYPPSQDTGKMRNNQLSGARDIGLANSMVLQGSAAANPNVVLSRGSSGPQVGSQVASKTVYYVRQPLDPQDSALSSGQASRVVPRSFPNAHEVRRLDGLRAQPASAPSVTDELSQRQDALEWSFSVGSAREDADDPTFGFSKRPAVKVVAAARRDLRLPGSAIGPWLNNHSDDVQSHILTESQTLDRRGTQRDYSFQRGAKENMPTTSSMSNISRTLASQGDDSCVRSADHKVLESRPAINTGCEQRMHVAGFSSDQSKLKQNTTSTRKPEVAYVLNI